MKVYGLARRSWSLAVLGCVNEARSAVEEAEALVADIGPGVHSTGVLASKVALAWLGGEWDAALSGAGTARRAADMSTVVRNYLQSMEISIRAVRGELRDALALVNQPAPGASETMFAWATAGALVAAGDQAGARTLLRDVADHPTDRTWLPHVLCRLAEVEHAAGDARAEREVLKSLEQHVSTQRRPPALGRGHVASRARRWSAAISPLPSKASGSHSSKGSCTTPLLARLLIGTLDPGAVEPLLSAHETFGELGAETDRRQIAALLRDRGAKVPRRRRRAPGTAHRRPRRRSPGWCRVGMRNREIAEAANYSERTVEVYLSRIYAKLGVSSRLQLARLLDERGPGEAISEE